MNQFRRIWSQKKVSVLVSENFFSEKKSQFWFQRIWSWNKSIGFEEFGLGKSIGFGQNFGLVIHFQGEDILINFL